MTILKRRRVAMKNMNHEVYVFGGIYFAVDDILNLISSFLGFIEKFLPEKSAISFIQNEILERLLGILFAVFFILLLRYIFIGKTLTFVHRVMEKFPKISIYLHYIGIIGYVLLVINALLIALLYFFRLNETAQQYVASLLIVVNIIGIILPLILATLKVFYGPDKLNKRNNP